MRGDKRHHLWPRTRAGGFITKSDRRYRRWRKAMLARSPLCALCLAEGRTVARGSDGRPNQLDHIVPTSQGGALMDPDNVQTLCTDHHREKSERERPRTYGCTADGDLLDGWERRA